MTCSLPPWLAGSPVAAEDPAGRGEELLTDHRRGHDLHVRAEAREPVRGGQFVFEREGELLPAVATVRDALRRRDEVLPGPWP
jgi:hypothetical protein